MPLLFAFLVAFVLTVMLVPVVARVARARGLVAQPTYDRWHERAIPNVGGISMLVPFLVVLVGTGLVQEMAPAVICCVLMYLIGIGDDLHPVRPATKLVLQMLVAAVLLLLLPPSNHRARRPLDPD